MAIGRCGCGMPLDDDGFCERCRDFPDDPILSQKKIAKHKRHKHIRVKKRMGRSEKGPYQVTGQHIVCPVPGCGKNLDENGVCEYGHVIVRCLSEPTNQNQVAAPPIG